MLDISAPGRRLLDTVLRRERELSILDAGAGDCQIALWLAEMGHDVAAVDKSWPIPNDGWTHVKGVTVGRLRIRQADVATMAFSEQFDRVLLLGVLHYAKNFREAEAVMRCSVQHLKPGKQIALNWIVQTNPPPKEQGAVLTTEAVEATMVAIGCDPVQRWSMQVHHAVAQPHDHLLAYQVWRRLR